MSDDQSKPKKNYDLYNYNYYYFYNYYYNYYYNYDENDSKVVRRFTTTDGLTYQLNARPNGMMWWTVETGKHDHDPQGPDSGSPPGSGLIGLIGGLVVGFQTKFLKFAITPTPHTPIPLRWELPALRQAGETWIKSGSFAWKIIKRGWISGSIFGFFDQSLAMYRAKNDWKNGAVAGLISGSIFGLRRGFAGSVQGAATFCIIGTLGRLIFR